MKKLSLGILSINKAPLMGCLFMFSSLLGVDHLYNKSVAGALSSYETFLVQHTKSSFERAIRRESNLNNSRLQSVDFFKDIERTSPHGLIPYFHVLNNLCSMKGASHLHIGLFTGASFISALYGNEKQLEEKIGIDWFKDTDTLGTKKIFLNACNKYLTKNNCQFLFGDCFAVDISKFKKTIDIYLYDAGHEKIDQEMAFTYYNNIFAKTFIAIVDDWALDEIREGTFNAFDKLNYDILYECEIPSGDDLGNGQYIAVIRKNV